jgi:hypothetical protein
MHRGLPCSGSVLARSSTCLALRAPRDLAYMHKYVPRSKDAMHEVKMQYSAKQ